MLMTYEDATNESAGLMAREWTSTFLDKLQALPTKTGKKRRLTGHFSFDFILSNINGQLYPIECNARVHTAVILLPLSHLAACYDRPGDAADSQVLQPVEGTITRSWIYNDIIMQYLPTLIPSRRLLGLVHPSLPPCIPRHDQSNSRPSTTSLSLKVDPTITGDDWVPFLIFWHVFWPLLLLGRWWDHKPWTRVSRNISGLKLRCLISALIGQCQYRQNFWSLGFFVEAIHHVFGLCLDAMHASDSTVLLCC